MLSRRLIRIKAFKTLFAYVGSGSDNAAAAQKTLIESCDKVKDLYYFLLNISTSLVDVAAEKIAAGMRKFRPTEEEAHPNLKFVHNRFAQLLSDDPEFGRYCQKHGLTWGEWDPFVRRVYNSIVTKDYYINYMASGEDSFEEDCRLFSCIFEDEFEDNEELLSILDKKDNPADYARYYKYAYNYLAVYYFSKGDKATAKDYYQKWLKYDPDNESLRKYVDSLK